MEEIKELEDNQYLLKRKLPAGYTRPEDYLRLGDVVTLPLFLASELEGAEIILEGVEHAKRARKAEDALEKLKHKNDLLPIALTAGIIVTLAVGFLIGHRMGFRHGARDAKETIETQRYDLEE